MYFYRSTTNLHDNGAEAREENVDLTVPEEVGVPRENTPHRGRKNKQSPFEIAVLKHISSAKPADKEEEADKHFLLSFLPMMKKLPTESKLFVRIKFNEIMQQALFGCPSAPAHFIPTQTTPNYPNSLPQFNQPSSQYSHFPTYYNQPNTQHNPNASQTSFHQSQHSQPHQQPNQILSPTPSESASNSDVFSVISEVIGN